MLRSRLAAAVAAGCVALLTSPLSPAAQAPAASAATTTPAGTYAVYCSGSTSSTFTGCYVDGATTALSVPAGSAVTTDPVVPPTGMATTGLTAPDGIMAVIPANKVPASLNVPAGATTFLYIDKQVSYFIPGVLGGATNLTLPLPAGGATIPYTPAGAYTGFGAGTYYLGSTNNGIQAVNCTGATSAALTGCTSPGGTPADSVKTGNDIGAPGSCITSSSVLATIGEGSTKPKTLFKNNEDYAAVREAYTTDGTTFHDVTPAGGISGLGNPVDQTNLRWVSPGGSMITNPDGSLGLFYSGGVCTDGDSDAFGSVYYSTSTDGGLTWSAGTQVSTTGSTYNNKLSTDYSYQASIDDQPANNPTNKALDVTAYYEGRIYSPSVVQNGDGTLTMTFAGYRTSKPLPAVGGPGIGRVPGTTNAAAVQYSPLPGDPALYRNILTVQLTLASGSQNSYTAGLPAVAQVQGGPWTLSQGDPAGLPYAVNGGAQAAAAPYPTFTPGGGPTNTFAGVVYPNLSTYPGSGSTGTAIPYTTAYAGDPGPLNGYCGTGGFGGAGPTGSPVNQPAGLLPMSPYYFPHIEANASSGLTGYFDYRPKDSDEAVVVANSSDKGLTWMFQTKALELSAGHCPYGNADAVLQTTNDDGQGHPFDLQVGGTKYLYTVVRAAGVLDTLGSQFVAHVLDPSQGASLGLPASEPTGTSQSTSSVGAQTITNALGGVSTSSFAVASTGATEMPGRIYVTPLPAVVPESPLTVALPITAAVLLGLGYLVMRRRRGRAAIRNQ